jgi:hypothetical protein
LPDPNGPHDVVVEFSAEKAHLVSSREWHPSLVPLVSWILELGPHARVVAPLALVARP